MRILLFSLLFSCLGFFSTSTYGQKNDKAAETVVHLLNYLSMDYSGAVQNGQILDEMEYKEQQEFSRRALDLITDGNFLKEKEKRKLQAQLQSLVEKVNEKADAQQISQLSLKVIGEVISLTGLKTAPKVWPNLQHGKKLYAQNCAMCHGTTGKGDGLAGKALEPQPSNFHDAGLMENFSPYQAFNSIRLGVPQTGMQAYTQFSTDEVWDLAFYIKSLRFLDAERDTVQLKAIFDEISTTVGLDNVANLSDANLKAKLHSLKIKNENALLALRTVAPDEKEVYNSLPIAKKGLLDALKSYESGNKKQALTLAISAYLEGIEPVEVQLKNIDPAFVGELEATMFNVRRTIEKDKGLETLEADIDAALDMIYKAEKMLSDQKMNYSLTFLLSLSIVLREALEAFLILAIVVSLIRSTGAKKALIWLHSGWISAVALGVLGWFLSDYVLRFGGRNREIMEGLVSIFAVIVLVWMGFWMHSKTHAAQWTKFVKEKIGDLLHADRMLGLAAFSFMVVFREAFEVILFLQAVNIEAIDGNKSAIGLGVLAASAIVAVIIYLFLKYTKKLPIRQLFKYSTWMMVILSIVLIGKGVHSLQESGWISMTNWSFIPRVEWLGMYPTQQSILAQILLFIIVVVVIKLNDIKNDRRQANAKQ